MMLELEEIWDGRLRTARKVKQRIETDQTETRWNRSDPYSAEPKSEELGKEKIEKFLLINGAEQAQ